MKKVIIPFDGAHFSEGAFEFARKLNEMEPILLAGVFLPEIIYPGNYGFTGTGLMEMPALIPFLEGSNNDEAEKNILRFKEFCVKYHIEHRVHTASGEFVLPQLKKETRYADLVILGSQLFYDHDTKDDEPGEYLASFLHHSECPVLLVPEQYEFPENNILAFDGSASSVFAIKQFAYLLPEFSSKSTLLVFADDDVKDSIPDLPYIEELASRHYKDLTIYKLEADAEKYFKTFVSDHLSPVLITGAYDRNILSRAFKKSFAENVIKDYNIPIFIAHF